MLQFTMINNLEHNDFTLVLSGGGALGIAHLGVLHDLEKRNLVPSEIVGTSMGGIIGACSAIGMNETQIYTVVKDFSSVYKWVKFSFQGNSIVDNEKIESMLSSIFGTRKMSNTDIPLKLICTNIKNGEKKVFDSKDDVLIKDVILATMAIPGVFNEHPINEETYVDGFLCENLGVNEASFDTILAVDVLGTNAYDSNLPDNFFKTANVLEMFEKSMRLLILNQSRTHLKNVHKNVILIEPNTKDFNTFHFHKHEEIREVGFNLLENKDII